jgi:signal peptidase I
MTPFRHDDGGDSEDPRSLPSYDDDGGDSEDPRTLPSYDDYGDFGEAPAPLSYDYDADLPEPISHDDDYGPEELFEPLSYDDDYDSEDLLEPFSDDDDDSEESPATLSWRRILVEWGIILVVASAVATGVALLVQAFVLKPFLVPTSSMANTIEQNERVLVDCVTFHLFGIHRGNIIVFKVPRSVSTTPLLKRVIGLPGDTLSLHDDRVYVNGKLLNEPYLRLPDGSLTPTSAAPNYGTPSEPWSLEQPYKVPAGRYFVMGDNRTKSDDSRYWGTVPRSAVIGRVFAVYWPLSRIKIL